MGKQGATSNVIEFFSLWIKAFEIKTIMSWNEVWPCFFIKKKMIFLCYPFWAYKKSKVLSSYPEQGSPSHEVNIMFASILFDL